MKEYNLNRHYKQHHGTKYGEYVEQGRQFIISYMKIKFYLQKFLLRNYSTVQNDARLSPYIISAEIAKSNKPFSDEEFVKIYSLKMAHAFGNDKLANQFQSKR